MKDHILLHHLSLHRNNADNKLGIILFKPGFSVVDVSEFREYCLVNNLKLVDERNILLSKDKIIGLYKNIFSYTIDDLKFGVSWKVATIEYLSSQESSCFLIEGNSATEKLSKYKYSLREKYGKITHPKVQLDENSFTEKVIKNLVHTVDSEVNLPPPLRELPKRRLKLAKMLKLLHYEHKT